MLAVAFLLFATIPVRAQNLSPLADPPDWRRLDVYQETVTRDEFLRRLTSLYAPHGGWQPFIRVDEDAAVIRTTNIPLNDLYPLRFARPWSVWHPPVPAYWHPRASLAPTVPKPARPLEGVRVMLDPGHLGGRWAQLEERWFKIGDAPPVMEGEMNLRVAQLLRSRLRALGASIDQDLLGGDISFRDGEPSTNLRPANLMDAARQALAEQGIAAPHETFSGPANPQRMFSVAWMANTLFTRADIRGRGQYINRAARPDLVVCLHFNAEAWGDPARPTLVDENHFHVLVNGCYAPDEIAKDDVRLELLVKLLNGSGPEELAIAERVAPALAEATGLPPYQYKGSNALRVGHSPYIWARNLLANRIYECPVVYLEPYVMNSPDVFARVQAGDYEGVRTIAGVERKSIFREYADGVADGLAAYYQQRDAH